MASTMDRKEVEAAARGVQDAEAFREACAVFGEADALARLHVFRTELATQLDRIEKGPSEPEQLREVAHRTAGRAGLFGFAALADASAQLEEALWHGTDPSAALLRWTEEARRAAKPESDTAALGGAAPIR